MSFLKMCVLLLPLCAEHEMSEIGSDEFPNDFLFGAATSAAQVESAWNIDGKGPSIWDTLTHEYPDKVPDGSNTGNTANSYVFYEEDVKAVHSMKMNHYRFSISWSRILPNGTVAHINSAGIAYYNKLIDTCLKYGIIPVVTIFHLDVPQSLQNIGGFTNDKIVDYFEAYADLVFSSFGDRVKVWTTINEPTNFCSKLLGTDALSPVVHAEPGVSGYSCGHNVLKAHAVAYHLYHKKYAAVQRGEIGITLSGTFFYSEMNDAYAVKRSLDFAFNWFAKPIFGCEGDYPAVMREQIDANSLREGRSKSRLPVLSKYWIDKIHGSADFMGLNYYSSRNVELLKVPTGADPSFDRDMMVNQTTSPEWPRGVSEFLYSVPSGLGDALRYIKDEYMNPRVFIHENGWSGAGELNDRSRVEYLRLHLQQVLKALNDGCNVIGYTVWSLIDTFEFMDGLAPKFGLFAVNFSSPEKTRSPRASAALMREVAHTHRIPCGNGDFYWK